MSPDRRADMRADMSPDRRAGPRAKTERDLPRLLARTEPYLRPRRMENSTIITNLYFWNTDEIPDIEKVGAYVRDEAGEVTGVAVNHRGWRVVLSSMSDEAADALEEALADVDRDVVEVVGPPSAAARFAARRGARLGRPWRQGLRVGMYPAGDHPMPTPPPGTGRPASMADLPLLISWLGGFYPAEQAWKATARAHNLAEHGFAYLWEVGGEPVAFAACTGVLWGVAQAGPIYTPPAHRGARYARAAARRALAAARDRGADVITTWINLDDPPAKWKRERVELIDEACHYVR